MVVVTDRRIAKDLDRKANIYSQRPDSYVSHDLITKGNHLLVMHYGENVDSSSIDVKLETQSRYRGQMAHLPQAYSPTPDGEIV